MALINLQTNLKSLKFGGDRPGGGSSSQPYVQKPIPSQNSDPSNVFNTGGSDSLLRGGLITPLKVADDVSRLTQMFSDLKSPNGILFTAKQNLLSRTSVKTESSKGAGYAGGFLNQGAYTPLSTLGQAAVGFSGTHLNTFGLDPSSPMAGIANGGLFPGLGLNRYEDEVKNKPKEENRLVGLFENTTQNTSTSNFGFLKGLELNNGSEILSYPGGPGSVLGIGRTSIKFASGQRTGINNSNFFVESGKLFDNPLYFNAKEFQKNRIDRRNPKNADNLILPIGSTPYSLLLNSDIDISDINKDGGYWINDGAKNVYRKDSDGPNLKSNANLKSESGWNGTTTMDQQEFESFKSADLFYQSKKIKDFRENLEAPTNKKVLGKLNKGFYANKNIEKRVNLGDPGKTQDVTQYGVTGQVLDKITASPIVSRSNPYHGGELNDLVKFSIGIIKNDSSGESFFMNFRSFINSFSDAYSADWGDTQYVGRADKFYNYKGFDRTINMSFTVAAQSKAELIPMYQKLNFLASSLAPTYSGAGFMQGNLVRLTVGGYLYNQVGILKGLTYDIPSESPWEIGINGGFDENGNPTDNLNDSSVKELPHIINVTGFQFIPIQDFVPRLSNPNNQINTRYISLSNGTNTNY